MNEVKEYLCPWCQDKMPDEVEDKDYGGFCSRSCLDEASTMLASTPATPTTSSTTTCESGECACYSFLTRPGKCWGCPRW